MSPVNPIVKLLLGGVGVVVIFLMFPILDLLDVFLQLVVLPLVFIGCFAVGAEGLYEGARVFMASGVLRQLGERLTTYREMAVENPVKTAS